MTKFGQKLKKENGAAALLLILIIGTSAFLMAFTAAQLGWGEMEMGHGYSRGKQALFLAEGCLDEALRRLKVDSSYSGETLSFGEKSCIIEVSGTGSTRNIVATGTAFSYTQRVEVDISLNGADININSWEEN